MLLVTETASSHNHHVHRRKRAISAVSAGNDHQQRDDLPKLTLVVTPSTQATNLITVTANASSSVTTLTTSTITSSSYTYEITDIPNTQTDAPQYSAQYDPYISRNSLPEGLLFIIIGAIVGAIILATMIYRIATSLLARRRAKMDSEKYEFSSNSIFFHSASSSMIDLSSNDKMSIYSAPSIHLLSKNIAAMLTHTVLELDSSISGKSYRNAINEKGAISLGNNRGSMFISPVLEMLQSSNYKLPAYHRGTGMHEGDSQSAYMDNNSTYELSKYGLLDSFVYSDESLAENDDERQQPKLERPRLSRPPSQLLDEILDLVPEFRDEEHQA